MSFWNIALALIVIILVIYILLKETNTPNSSTPSPTPRSTQATQSIQKNIVVDIPYSYTSHTSQPPYYPQSMPRNVYLDYVNNGYSPYYPYSSYPPYYPGYNYTWDPYFYNWNNWNYPQNTEKIENKVDNKPNISINNIIPKQSPKSLLNISKKVSQPLPLATKPPIPLATQPPIPLSTKPPISTVMPTYSP